MYENFPHVAHTVS